ncbi:hypothetical protein HanXRQr2_Chr15g0673511 [Helianthus annuus]|uniref:Uncharacterized protein n=1 Tax=Helianthus annuus TaxID=4232 RepID=A0A251S5H9_HELAN|nr:hypothetical protein HanXRQr2_Chr15g0673511 [Helianthus annuus]
MRKSEKLPFIACYGKTPRPSHARRSKYIAEQISKREGGYGVSRPLAMAAIQLATWWCLF